MPHVLHVIILIASLAFCVPSAAAISSTMTDSCKTDSCPPTDSQQHYRIAIKTNMLFDLALAPNLEIEIPLDRLQRWSLMAEWWSPWYIWKNNSHSYQMLTLGAELRYWLGERKNRSTLTGWFAGIYGAWDKYDLEWKSVGDQGRVWSAGVSGGYSWRLSEHWNLEASLALGYITGTRHHYNGEFNDEHLIWKYDADMRYFGPTKAKLSIVWLLWKKKGGCR